MMCYYLNIQFQGQRVNVTYIWYTLTANPIFLLIRAESERAMRRLRRRLIISSPKLLEIKFRGEIMKLSFLLVSHPAGYVSCKHFPSIYMVLDVTTFIESTRWCQLQISIRFSVVYRCNCSTSYCLDTFLNYSQRKSHPSYREHKYVLTLLNPCTLTKN
jgi:hypothetical protein